MTTNLEIMSQEEIQNASTSELCEAATIYGESVARMNISDAPVVGKDFETADNETIEIESKEEAKNEFIKAVATGESEHMRQFSPAEFWIAALNSREDCEVAWEAVEKGIYMGIEKVAKSLENEWSEQEQSLEEVYSNDDSMRM